MDRLPPAIVVEELTTTAAKIRALATAGYSRSEIANFLHIRYQNVRNVLLRSGIEAVPSDRPRRSADTQIVTPTEPWPINRLLQAGFELVGSCRLTTNDAFEYSHNAPAKPGVYAFAVNGSIAYIGLTRGALRTRLGHYVYGHARQRTSARVKGLILASLARGEAIEVYIACPPNLEWNGLPVDGSTGLETGLIRLIRPPWNQQGLS